MATTYTVIAPLVIAKNEQGADLYIYKGGQVPDGQSDEWIASHKDSGMIATPTQAVKAEAAEQKAAAESAPSK
jgi:hypothetical protein